MGSKLYTRGERIFKWVSLVLLLVICVATLAPFVLILASSLTDETTLITYGYSFWPQKFSMESYLYMWNQRKQIGRSYLTSLGITAVGTVVSLLFTTMLAYPMSRKDFKYSNQLSFFVFFTMLFNGGIVSSYIMWTQIFHIKNTYFALLLPNLLMNAMNIMLVRNYYKNSIPFELVEAAEIDGANAFDKFFRITMPCVAPVLVYQGILNIINSFQYFTQVYVIINASSGGGASNASGGPANSILMYPLYLFNTAFSYMKMGRASAMAWLLFVIVFVLTLVMTRITKKVSENGVGGE